MSDYYVYLHRKATNGEVFYVGKGKTKRAYDHRQRSVWWQRTVAKHGLIIEIREKGLQEWYAFELEAELIAYYGRADLKHGSLVNCTDGGEGAGGNIQSEETRRLRSLANVGQKRSVEACLNIRNGHLKFLSENPDAIEKKRRAHSFEMKKVLRSDGITYESVHAAGKAITSLGFSKNAYSHISSCCNGKRKTAFGFTWKFIYD